MDGRRHFGRYMMIGRWILLASIFFPAIALADDVDAGREIAQRRCASCHVIAPHQGNEVAIAPPFVTIARKNGFGVEMLAYSILEPHPRMNLAITRREANDVAAYILSFAK
jgi:mono/diheme cytochrome c family protein